MIPVYYIFNSLFSILLVLHIIWFYYIVKIAYKVSISHILKRNTDHLDNYRIWQLVSPRILGVTRTPQTMSSMMIMRK